MYLSGLIIGRTKALHRDLSEYLRLQGVFSQIAVIDDRCRKTQHASPHCILDILGDFEFLNLKLTWRQKRSKAVKDL